MGLIEISSSAFPGATSPIAYYPTNYPFKLKAFVATLTGTSTADSSLTLSIVRHDPATTFTLNDILLNLTTSSTATTVSGNLEPVSTASAVLYGDIIVGLNDSIEVSFVNNGSVDWLLYFEEMVEE